jgi:hypothetical protein
MTTIYINTSDTIKQINENNDSKKSLGDGDKVVQLQEKNGMDLLCQSEFSKCATFEIFDTLNPPNYMNEMTEYENAKNDYEKNAFLKKYHELAEKMNEEVQGRSNSLELSNEKKIEKFTNIREKNYEDMYKDEICTFFIGSVTLIGLYVVYKMIERD